MAAKPPPTATTILATPIGNVEDSRAQRLQRQQSRFRDRGGIFIPSSRNTLADILLGKASPIKKPRRSASVSPSKGRRNSKSEKPKSLVRPTPVHEENLRRSPRKQGRTSSVASGAGNPRPISVVSSHRGSKALVASHKASSEPVTRESPTNASNEVDDNSTLVKGASGKKTSASRRAKKSTSKAKAPKPTKKVANPSESHENAPRSKRTRASAKISSADLMDGHASEPKLSEVVSSIAPPSNASTSGKPSKSKKTSRNTPTDGDGGYEEEGASKGRKKPAAAKQSSSSNKKSLSKSSAPPKPSKSRVGAPQLPDIMEEDEEDAPPLSVISSRNDDKPSTRKKRLVSVEEDLDERPRKRAKPARKDVTVKKEKTKVTSKRQVTPDEELSSVQRKRRRIVEQDADADEKADKPAKLKKVSESEKVDNSPLKSKKNLAKPRTKSAPKTQNPAADKAPTKTARRKENSIALTRLETPQVSVPPRRGLPKSILLRLQNSSAPHVVDDEPDPIDFLS